MLLRATENAVAGHIWPAGHYLPTPVLAYRTFINSCTFWIASCFRFVCQSCFSSLTIYVAYGTLGYHRLITMMLGMLINSIAVPLKVRDLCFCSVHGARGSCFSDSDTK